MGISTSEQSKETLLDRLQFVQTSQDQHFGKVEIFKFKEPPYEYMMKLTRVFREEDGYYKDIYQLLQNLRMKTHKNIAKIQYIEKKQEKQMCIIHHKLLIYCNYYNFTLQKALEKKKANGLHFSENELWYVLSTLLDVGRYLQEQKTSFGNYRTRDIFLTPQGYYIKLYLLNNLPENQHNAYFTVLASKQQIQNHLLAPEQLKKIRNGTYTIEFDVFKADLFSVGMIMLELIFMDHPKFYYDVNGMDINMNRIKYNLATLKREFSYEFHYLLSRCLEEDPQARFSFKEAANYVDQNRMKIMVAGCIKLVDDEEGDAKKKMTAKKHHQSQANFKYLSKSIEQKLMVIPISSYAEKRNDHSDYSAKSKIPQSSSTSSSLLSHQNRPR